MISELIDNGVEPEALFFFNLDDQNLLDLFKRPEDFLKFIRAYHPAGKAYIFIDEVQRVKNAGIFLKYLYDLQPNIKLIVSGSSSLEISAKTKEYLTGRKKVFNIHPFSFTEILSYKAKLPDKILSNDLFDIDNINKKHSIFGAYLKEAMEELIIYGGYPKVLLRKTPEKKKAELYEIYSSYIQKDVKDYLKIENIAVFNRLVSLLAFQIGNLVNRQELSISLQSAWVTIEKYIRILEETFVVKMLPPYYTNKRKEITKMHKVYYLDSGVRNFIAGNFSLLDQRPDKGPLYENIFFSEISKVIKAPIEIRFWRTQAGAEVDFIITRATRIIPVEIKAGRLKKAIISKSLKNYITAHEPATAIIATTDFCGKTTYGKTNIYLIPLCWLLLKNSLTYLLSL